MGLFKSAGNLPQLAAKIQVERNDRTYVYLKPHGADDEAIRKRMKYPGSPPVYIPMPPH